MLALVFYGLEDVCWFQFRLCYNWKSWSYNLALFQKNVSIWWLFCVYAGWNIYQQIMNREIFVIWIWIAVPMTPWTHSNCCIGDYMYHIHKKVIRWIRYFETEPFVDMLMPIRMILILIDILVNNYQRWSVSLHVHLSNR